jgi:putative hydrolase of the HAD superfamily
MESSLRAVFFDAGGTILHVRDSVGKIYAAAAEKRGCRVDPGEVSLAFRTAWKKSLERRQGAGYKATDEILRQEWRQVVLDSFGGRLAGKAADEVFEELYDHFSGPDPWLVADGARETFAALKDRGIAIGILSNWDSRLPGCLEDLGILGYFDHLVISYQVGVEKPHRLIFEEACRVSRAPPGSLLMVGDSLEQDIRPAIELGWKALWFSREESEIQERKVLQVKGFREIQAHILENDRLENDRPEN